MDPRISAELRTILTEFDTIKNSLSPIIAEVKKMQEMRIEIKRFKEETDSKLKKLDFEMRHLSQKEPQLKEVIVTKNRIDELSSQIDALKRQYANVQKVGDISKEVDHRVKEALSKMPPSKTVVGDKSYLEEINKARAENKRAISMLKNELDEVDQKHLKLMSTTREKTAALITEGHHLSKQVEESLIKHSEALKNISEFENWFRHSEKTLLTNDENAKRHMDQLVNEINNNRKEIYFSRKELEKFSKKIDDFTITIAKLEKKQTTELSEVKNRTRDIERKTVQKGEVDKIQSTLLNQQKEELLRMDTELNKAKEIMAHDLKKALSVSYIKFKNDLEILKKETETANNSIRTMHNFSADIDTIKKNIDSLSIKVANTSKIIEELEKVL